MPSAGDYGCDPVVAVGVRSDLRMCRDAKHDGIYTCLVGIAFENHGLDAGNTGTSRAGFLFP